MLLVLIFAGCRLCRTATSTSPWDFIDRMLPPECSAALVRHGPPPLVAAMFFSSPGRCFDQGRPHSRGLNGDTTDVLRIT